MIRADTVLKVKAAILALGFLALGTDLAIAQTPSERDEGALPPIDAQEFNVRLTKTSTSGKVLLLEDLAENNPKPGKILLLKSADQEVCAVRVLKNYESKFAAKIVLPFTAPALGSEYRALKKLGNKIVKMIQEREQRQREAELQLPPGSVQKSDDDLAKEVAPDDSELDRGVPQNEPKLEAEPKGAEPLFNKEGDEITPESIEVKEEDEALPELAAKDEGPLDPHIFSITAQYALMNNLDSKGSLTNYNSAGIRLGITPLKRILLRGPKIQDSLSVDVGLFYYTITAFESANDQLTLLPLVGAARYSLNFGPTFTVFGYAGALRQYVMVNAGTFTAAMEPLQNVRLAAGGGLMIRLGPGWFVRSDLGVEMLSVGVSLRL
jgi:hypothetical protein